MTADLRTLAWDDFRLVRAIAEARGMAGAAAALGLNHSTVFRRLAQIEGALGATLFERRRAGYQLTPAGEEMSAVAAEIDERITGFFRRVEAREITIAGELRVATADGLLIDMLTPLLHRFQQAYPDIRLDVLIGNAALSLTRRDADVAIRATTNPPENLVGRRIAHVRWALFGRAEDFPDGAQPSPEALRERDWATLGDELGALELVRLAQEGAGPGRIKFRANSVLALTRAVEAGIGIGYLPWMARDRPGLIALSPPLRTFGSELWLLTHPDLKQSPRVRAFMDFMGRELTAMKGAIEGEG